MWKWLGFLFGLVSLGSFAAAIVFSDVLLAKAGVSFISTAFLLIVVASWAILIVIMTSLDDRYARGFAWISGISIFASVMAYFLVQLLQSDQPFGWLMVVESLLGGIIIFGVPISVSCLLILNTFRKYKP